MATKKSSGKTRGKGTGTKEERELRQDAKKALKETKKILEAEIKRVDSYIRALDGHISFNR